MSSTILSTKKLTASQKELLRGSRITVFDYDAIAIEYLRFEWLSESVHDFYVFTSQNAVKSVLKKNQFSNTAEKRALCVGTKTRHVLESNGFGIIETAQSASDLAKIILKKYKKNSFLFFSGNLRREELPKTLMENNIRYKEIQVYRTTFNTNKIDRSFEGVLFFSPSGVRSYMEKNSLNHGIAFCIGTTTAKEAKKHTDKIIISNIPTVEELLATTIKHYSIND